jgi:NADP-dependent 3-hydroxy acid dehydrogenase YdfG
MTRTALITGASSGIGRAVASRLLDQGHQVIGLSRTIDDSTFEHDQFTGFQADLSDLAALPDRLGLLLQRFPTIDSAVFCAGQGLFGCLEEFSYSQMRSVMDLNFTSQAYVARALVPIFKRNKKGDMVFIGSEAALSGSRKGTVYCASKFALRGFTQALRDECGKSGLRITLINPGMVNTSFFNGLSFTHGESASHAIEPEDIAKLVSTVFEMRSATILDEINLSPRSTIVRFKS